MLREGVCAVIVVVICIVTSCVAQYYDMLTTVESKQTGLPQLARISYSQGLPYLTTILELKATEEITSVYVVNSLGPKAVFSVHDKESNQGSIKFTNMDDNTYTMFDMQVGLSYIPYSVQAVDTFMKIFWTAGATENSDEVLGDNHYTIIYMSDLYSFSGIRRIRVMLPEMETTTQTEFVPCSLLTTKKSDATAFDGTIFLTVDKIQLWTVIVPAEYLNQEQTYDTSEFTLSATHPYKEQHTTDVLSMECFNYYLYVGGYNYLYLYAPTFSAKMLMADKSYVTGLATTLKSVYASEVTQDPAPQTSICNNFDEHTNVCAKPMSISANFLSYCDSEITCQKQCSVFGVCQGNTCSCPKGISDDVCSTCDPQVYCNGNGVCDQYNGGCICSKGSGPRCENVQCNGLPGNEGCSNHGVCLVGGQCRCDDGYSGSMCEFTSCNGINSTDPLVCNGRGECVLFDQCKCTDMHWSGQFCEFTTCNHLNSTSEKVCSGHGECIDFNNCHCNSEWSGDVCQFTVCDGFNSSSPEACSGHGECVEPNTCKCSGDWSGLLCEFTECFGFNSSNPNACSGHGECTSADYCSCFEEYSGLECEFTICFGTNSSDISVCSHHGRCVGHNECKCVDSYSGANCEYTSCFGTNSSEPTSCSGHGHCIEYDDCKCDAHWSGLACSFTSCFQVNSSDDSVCSGKGECLGYNYCSCENGYSGLDCNFASCFGYNSTDSFVCSAHGSCTEYNDCDCSEHYSGLYCQFTECFGRNSSASGVCTGRGECEKFNQCNCRPSYSGENCQYSTCFGTNSTSDSVCSSHGLCTDFNTCQCEDHWSGFKCEYTTCYNKNSSSSASCSGHGSCVSYNKCVCEKGWDITDDCSGCDDAYCMGHGKCISKNMRASCKCDRGFIGDRCTLCDPNVLCSGHGNCTVLGSSYFCNCTDPWTGSDCSQPPAPVVHVVTQLGNSAFYIAIILAILALLFNIVSFIALKGFIIYFQSFILVLSNERLYGVTKIIFSKFHWANFDISNAFAFSSNQRLAIYSRNSMFLPKIALLVGGFLLWDLVSLLSTLAKRRHSSRYDEDQRVFKFTILWFISMVRKIMFTIGILSVTTMVQGLVSQIASPRLFIYSVDTSICSHHLLCGILNAICCIAAVSALMFIAVWKPYKLWRLFHFNAKIKAEMIINENWRSEYRDIFEEEGTDAASHKETISSKFSALSTILRKFIFIPLSRILDRTVFLVTKFIHDKVTCNTEMYELWDRTETDEEFDLVYNYDSSYDCSNINKLTIELDTLLVRNVIWVAMVVILQPFPITQIVVVLCVQIYYCTFLLVQWPFKTTKTLVFVLLKECAIVFQLIALLVLAIQEEMFTMLYISAAINLCVVAIQIVDSVISVAQNIFTYLIKQ